MNLTASDVRKLVREPSPKTREALAAKIAHYYRLGEFTKAEKTIAADIFRILLKEGSEAVRQALAQELAHCPSVPHDIRLKLKKPDMSIMGNTRPWATLGLTPADSRIDPGDDELVEDFVDDLYAKGRLTASLLMRALCTGHLAIFETGIARLAKVPRAHARILLLDRSGLGIDALYNAAGLPGGFLDAVKIVLRIALEETGFGSLRPDDFRKRVTERIQVGRYHRTVENMQYLLSIIGGKIVATADAA